MTKRSNGFIKLDHQMMNTEAWQSLSPGETALLLFIWSKHNGKNNGNIGCGRREIQQRFKCSPNTAVLWTKGLQEKGFIISTIRGSFNQKTGGGRTTRWRLTMEKHDGNPPTMDFTKWQPGNSERRYREDTNSGYREDTNIASTLVH